MMFKNVFYTQIIFNHFHTVKQSWQCDIYGHMPGA